MNSNSTFVKQLMFFSRRQFSLYNYSAPTNPKVFLTLSKNGEKLGDLVFELYQNHAPKSTENFLAFVTGQNKFQASYKGTTFTKGFPGIAI